MGLYLTIRLRQPAGLSPKDLAHRLSGLGVTPHPEYPGRYLTAHGILSPDSTNAGELVRCLDMRVSWTASPLALLDTLDLARRLPADVLLESDVVPEGNAGVQWLLERIHLCRQKFDFVHHVTPFPELDQAQARQMMGLIEAARHMDLCAQLMELAVAYAHWRARWQLASLVERAEIDASRTTPSSTPATSLPAR